MSVLLLQPTRLRGIGMAAHNYRKRRMSTPGTVPAMPGKEYYVNQFSCDTGGKHQAGRIGTQIIVIVMAYGDYSITYHNNRDDLRSNWR
jgi:hypothetical protein